MRSKTTGIIVVLVVTALAWMNYYEHERLKASRKQVASLTERVHRLEGLLEQARLPVAKDAGDDMAQARLMQGRQYEAAVEAFERRLKTTAQQAPPFQQIKEKKEPAQRPVTKTERPPEINELDDYAEFEAAMPARIQLQIVMFALVLADADIPLYEDQQENLLELMTREMEGFSMQDLLWAARRFVMAPESRSPDKELLANLETYHRQVLADAATFLTPEQINILSTLFDQQRKMEKARLIVLNSMMTGSM